jgi:hypothetical protein
MGSAWYVYAIVGRETSLPVSGFSTGLAELTKVPCGKLAAVTQRVLAVESAPVTMEAVLHHEAVVETVRRQGPALPVRFGTVFRDASLVASALAERYAPLEAALHRLGDKVEMSLTALWSGAEAGDARSHAVREQQAVAEQSAGARYLYARAAELRDDETLKRRARIMAEELDQILGGFALERRTTLLPTPRIAVRIAFLLNPAELAAFQSAFETLRRVRSEMRVVLTGPWPPYTFVKESQAEDISSDNRLGTLFQLLTEEIREARG